MKKTKYFIIVLSVFILAITFLSATKVMAQDYPEGMISYWKFDEGNGDIAHDSVNGHDGTLDGDPEWTTGKVGGALSFDGAGDVVRIPYSDDWNTGDELTVEAWFNLNSHTYWGAIVSRDGYACGDQPWYLGWVLEIYYSQIPTVITFRVASGVDPNVILTYPPIPPSPDIIYGEWYHAVGVDDGSSIRLYINGQEVGTGTSRLDPVNPSDQYGITIGSDTGCWGFDLDGKIDEVAIYNRALTPVEIQQHYQNGLIGLGYELPLEVMQLNCVGFEPPMDKVVAVKKKNRVLPLKMVCTDEDTGMEVTDLDITAQPVVEIDFTGGDPTDPPGDAFLSAGQGDEGNQFVYTGSKWQFNLQSKNFSGPGTYTIKAVSGDPNEYLISESCCTAEFVIQ